MNCAYRSLRSTLVLLGLICFVLLGCVNAIHAIPHNKTPAQVARLGREFKVRARHSIALPGEGLRIKFISVKEDSRCPADVTCVWAGNAAVQLSVSLRGRGSKTLTLNTSKSLPASGENQYRGYKFKLVELSPYPRSNRKIAPGDYVATLLVTRN